MILSSTSTHGRGKQSDVRIAIGTAWLIAENPNPLVTLEIYSHSWKQLGSMSSSDAQAIGQALLEAAASADADRIFKAVKP